jgi:hypothetical protein
MSKNQTVYYDKYMNLPFVASVRSFACSANFLSRSIETVQPFLIASEADFSGPTELATNN